MGACASKFKEFKDATSDEVPPPATKEEEESAVTQRELKLVEEAVIKDDVPPPATGGEAKSQSLGRLFEEEVKQEVPTGENKKVETGGLKTDERKAVDMKPAIEGVENEAPQADAKAKAAEAIIIKTSQEVEIAKTEETDENKAGEEFCSDKKHETLDVDKKTEEPSPASEEKNKEIEEKLIQIKIEEQKVAFDEEDKKVEEKLTETTKFEEQKPVPDEEIRTVEEKPVETTETKEQKPTSEEEKKEIEEKPAEVEIQQPASGVEVELAENAKNENPVNEIEDKPAVEPLKAETAVESKPDERCVIDEKVETPAEK